MPALDGYWKVTCLCGLQRLLINEALVCMTCDGGAVMPKMAEAVHVPLHKATFPVVLRRGQIL